LVCYKRGLCAIFEEIPKAFGYHATASNRRSDK
jgi:hypothetical protein